MVKERFLKLNAKCAVEIKFEFFYIEKIILLLIL